MVLNFQVRLINYLVISTLYVEITRQFAIHLTDLFYATHAYIFGFGINCISCSVNKIFLYFFIKNACVLATNSYNLCDRNY
jgi:hypothetical protein